jgi:MSHA biogenesis protein MshP
VTRRTRGFSLVTALFLLIVLALLGAAIAAIFQLQVAQQSIDVNASRGHAAAQAGIEWALVQIMDPDNDDPALAASPRQPPACFAQTVVPAGGTAAAYTITVACTRALTTEVDRQVAVYDLTATAVGGGGAYAVERRVAATVARCVDPNGTAPRFACP